jgi:hypothetical protein
MVYIIMDPEDGFIHMVTTNREQAEQEYQAVLQEDSNLVLRTCVDEATRLVSSF